MKNLNLASLKLLKEESRDIIEFLTRKRNIEDYKTKSNNDLFQAIEEINKQQKSKSKNEEGIDTIREELKDLSYKLSKSELKEIRKNLYNIEKRKQFE